MKMKTFSIAAAAVAAIGMTGAASAQDNATQPEAEAATTATPAAPAAPTAAAPVTQADVTVGANVVGPDGSAVGTIESADATGAVVSTGTARARLPFSNFRRTDTGLQISVNRAEFEAAVGGQPQPSAPQQ